MAGKPFLAVGMDSTEASALAGFLSTLSTEIKTARHIGPVLKMTHAIMSNAFTEYMSTLAPAQASRFHHVYEWGMIGVPQAKLWNDKLVGGGNNRIATFTWKASKKTVPVREDFASKGVKQIHVFVWKAPIMEYGDSVTITPKRGEFLAYFTGPTTPEGKYPGPGNKETPVITRNPIHVQNPGGAATGQFTREYVAWWGGAAGQATFDSQVRNVLENDLGKMPIEETTAKFRRARKKTFGMQSAADSERAFEAGRIAARKYLQARSANYIEQARARERLIFGDE